MRFLDLPRLVASCLGLFVIVGCDKSSDLAHQFDAPRPSVSASVNPDASGSGTERVRIAEAGLVRPLTADELSQIGAHNFGICILDIKYIRDVEAGLSSAQYVESTAVDELWEIPMLAPSFCSAVRAWARQLRDEGEVSLFGLWTRFGPTALFADVAIHGGAGDPILRALVGASFQGLGDFDATVSAAYGRYASVLATLPDVPARVQWILSNPNTAEVRFLLLFNLQDPGVEALADVYDTATENTGYAVSRDELAWLFARVAVARRHPARSRLKPSDLERPDIAEYIRERDVRNWGAFAATDVFIGVFERDEERHARKHFWASGRYPRLTRLE